MEDVSIIALIAVPERFDGKLVRLMGWASFAFESHGIFISRETAAVARNGLWLDVRLTSDMLAFGGSMVVVEGVFDSQSRGHLGMWSGTLTKIQRLQSCEDGPMKNLLSSASDP